MTIQMGMVRRLKIEVPTTTIQAVSTDCLYKRVITIGNVAAGIAACNNKTCFNGSEVVNQAARARMKHGRISMRRTTPRLRTRMERFQETELE